MSHTLAPQTGSDHLQAAILRVTTAEARAMEMPAVMMSSNAALPSSSKPRIIIQTRNTAMTAAFVTPGCPKLAERPWLLWNFEAGIGAWGMPVTVFVPPIPVFCAARALRPALRAQLEDRQAGVAQVFLADHDRVDVPDRAVGLLNLPSEFS